MLTKTSTKTKKLVSGRSQKMHKEKLLEKDWKKEVFSPDLPVNQIAR
jgi:hypothetical protein